QPHEFMPYQDNRSGVRKAIADVRDMIFLENTEVLYSTLLMRSYFTTGIYSFISTTKFDVFNYITDKTPKYIVDEQKPWLFYFDQLNGEPSSFYYKHSQEEIDTYCNNIKDLADKLYDNYKMKMVFMAIPSKYTIYHDLLNDDKYNNFIPRLYAGLEKRGIPVIPVYEDFIEAEDTIYYGTDTHWNKKGLSIALDNAVEVLDSLNIKATNHESSTLSWWFRNQDK
ncbi:MAG: alginate O-acetyltransferase AlgX-related protein, partial [Bacteroidales bacterium]